jgi:hypothetical protein
MTKDARNPLDLELAGRVVFYSSLRTTIVESLK